MADRNRAESGALPPEAPGRPRRPTPLRVRPTAQPAGPGARRWALRLGDPARPHLLLTIRRLKLHSEDAKRAGAPDRGVPSGGRSPGRAASAWTARRTQVAT
ncbi:hypothetical protein NDU88_006468 [Pleurodeles waltl]|uniref:Uncharacterized protein n=1 Tax=Pleurodeles waltl TaxID=8319 RepID=A0AAV7QIT9_PLEWA|nr:hypothetical protein NDU88_006468 [Pleurodeles waltl]